jgi:thymidine phosphorylase
MEIKAHRHLEWEATVSAALIGIAETFGLRSKVVLTDGVQPVGRGIGPALEARDVLSVLTCNSNAPPDLRSQSIALAGGLLELSKAAPAGGGAEMTARALDDGAAWAKFQRICEAQGRLRVPPTSRQQRPLAAERAGRVRAIDNRRIARLAKLAGAPDDKAAGVELHVAVGAQLLVGKPVCTVHAESPGELTYAFDYAMANRDIILVGDQ